jgi:hypothetical protein
VHNVEVGGEQVEFFTTVVTGSCREQVIHLQWEQGGLAMLVMEIQELTAQYQQAPMNFLKRKAGVAVEPGPPMV